MFQKGASKPEVKVDEGASKSAFDKALAEVEDMMNPDPTKGIEDKIALSGMGFKVVGLVEKDEAMVMEYPFYEFVDSQGAKHKIPLY